MYPVGSGPYTGHGQEFRFYGNAQSNATAVQVFALPKQFSFMHVFALAGGGAGGNGVVGANSTAGGGGGGGSGSQTSLLIPTKFLPEFLYISVGGCNSSGAGQPTQICLRPDAASSNQRLLTTNGGGVGGNASGGTGGTGGAAGSVASIATMPLALRGVYTFVAGQTGVAGGNAVAGAAQALPVTGLFCMGGTGGGGLPAAAAVGTDGGLFTAPAGNFFPTAPGGAGAPDATTPGGDGSAGRNSFNGLEYFYGGAGGGSSHGSATGAGLVGGNGGIGGFGCGGGGGGGALTGSTQGLGGRGGPGLLVITLF